MGKFHFFGAATARVGAIAAVVVSAFVGSARAQNTTTYLGNGATGFAGPVGTGSLVLSSDGAGNITFTLNPGSFNGHPASIDGNNLAIYISTGTVGLSNTGSLTANGNPPGSDAGNESISGYSSSGQRSLVTFPTGFNALYAFSFANAYDGLFKLSTDGSGGLSYITGATPQTPPNASVPLNTLTIPLTDIGATQGQTISFVATLIDGGSTYRSNETFADATTGGVPLNTVGNPGFNSEIDFTDFDVFNTAAVAPEPASLALLSVGGLVALRRRRH